MAGERMAVRRKQEAGTVVASRPPSLFLFSMYTDLKRPIKVGAQLLPVVTMECGVWGGELTSKRYFLSRDF